jgi:DNA-directed RNA polymerase specialized sigma24 family protein
MPYIDDAYRLAHWLTGNSSDAEDVVQDASLRADPSVGFEFFGERASAEQEDIMVGLLSTTRRRNVETI